MSSCLLHSRRLRHHWVLLLLQTSTELLLALLGVGNHLLELLLLLQVVHVGAALR